MENNNTKIFGVILLAAGGSARLGTPKQSLVYAGKTLLLHSLQAASDSNAYCVILVLGANADSIKKDIGNVNASIIINADWQEGMASSIRSGIKALEDIDASVEGAILMVCDQPYVSASLLNGLIAVHQHTGKPIVTCG